VRRRRAAVLAVDGGNSKTDLALVSRSGDLLALVSGPTTSHQQVPMDKAMARLSRLAVDAARGAGVELPAEIGSFCVAGADFASDVRVLTQALTDAGVASRLSVRNDAFGALRAGAASGWGIVLVCGAGVNAAGIGPDGRTARLAGIGDLSGDWGGGQGIGREALGVAVRATDGRGAPTRLAHEVPSRLGVRRPLDVSRGIYEGTIDARRLEELAPLVFDLAADGDLVARGIADRMADELAVMAGAIGRRLRLTRRPVEVVLTGGVFGARDPAFHRRLADGIHAAMPDARLARLAERPVLGAALLGLDDLGVPRGGGRERRLRSQFAE
jgi:N-acetylglucosamine kinase-like BadF-type ATPase